MIRRLLKRFSVPELLSGVYTAGILVVLPLIFDDAYFNLIETKSACFTAVTAGYAVLFFVLSLFRYGRGESFWERLIPKEETVFSKGLLLDAGVLLFGAAVLVSCLLSPDQNEAWYGTRAYCVGGFYILLAAAAYFFLSRSIKSETPAVYALTIGGGAVMILGLLNRFGIDPLSMAENLSSGEYSIWLSTIGNTDFYHAFLVAVLSFFAVCCLREEPLLLRILHGLLVIAGFLGVWISTASGAFLSLGAVFFFFVCDGFCSRRRMCFAFLFAAVFFWTGAAVKLLTASGILHVMPGAEKELSQRLLHTGILFPAAAVFTALVLLFWYFGKIKNPPPWEKLWFPWLLSPFFAALVLFGKRGKESLEALIGSRAVIFGYALQCFREAAPLEKLFGVGPGRIDVPMSRLGLTTTKGRKFYNYTLQTAHNEPLDYLVTTGIFGAAGVLLIAVSVYIVFFDERKKPGDPVSGADAFAAFLTAYFAQAFVNGSTPVLFGVFFVMLAYYRKLTYTEKECVDTGQEGGAST